MSEREIEAQSKAPERGSTLFDADTLFRDHRTSVVNISDRLRLGPNSINTTLGSGFVIDRVDSSSGTFCRIATDNHVVAHASEKASVNLGDGKSFPFEVELRDQANDLAILKVRSLTRDECQLLAISNLETEVSKGDSVLKLGARNGDANSSAAIVETYFTRSEAGGLPLLPGENPDRKMVSMLINDKFSQSGDSGGPIIDSSGKVIAVMDAEGSGVIAGTPAHILLTDLQKLHSADH